MISSNLRGHETSYNKPLPVPTVTNRCGGDQRYLKDKYCAVSKNAVSKRLINFIMQTSDLQF